jgi:hypothetical protein
MQDHFEGTNICCTKPEKLSEKHDVLAVARQPSHHQQVHNSRALWR